MSSERIINFMGQRKIAVGISALMLIVSIVSLAVQGLNFGLDFTGGTSIELTYETPADLGEIRGKLAEAGYGGAVIKYFGSETAVLISLQESGGMALGNKIADILRADGNTEITIARADYVGPQVGAELRDSGGLGMILALISVMIYVSLRFQFKFSVGAVLALIHDVIVVLGFFSVFQWDFDLTVLAAIMAVIGYSINDTIVVFDRIRENFRIMRKSSVLEVFNSSITQTMSRTLVTSLTTVLVLVALFYFGGSLIHGFASALLIGVIVGTYSSVYVASAILIMLHVTKEDLMPPAKEGEGFDSMP